MMKPQDIMHPEDAKAIQLVKNAPLCESLVRLFMEMGYCIFRRIPVQHFR